VYKYKPLFDHGVLLMTFYGDYFADEILQSYLAIVKTLKLDEAYALKILIIDLADVTSMTLHNTDAAGLGHWEKTVIKALAHPEKNSAEHLKSLQIHYVLPKDSAIREIFIERLLRITGTTERTKTQEPNNWPGIRHREIGNRAIDDLPSLLGSLDLLQLLPLLGGEKWTLKPGQFVK
jgi:hypothetical protein